MFPWLSRYPSDEELIFYLGGIGWPRRQPSLLSWAIDWISLPPLYPRARLSIDHMHIYESHGHPGPQGSARFVRLDRTRLLGTFDFVDEIIFVSKPIGQICMPGFPQRGTQFLEWLVASMNPLTRYGHVP